MTRRRRVRWQHDRQLARLTRIDVDNERDINEAAPGGDVCKIGHPELVRPVSGSADEVVRFLEAIPSLKSRTALTTVYAVGLRVSEVVLLKIADIDSRRMVIRIEQGKRGKDRYVMLSPQLLRILRTYWRLARPKRWLFPGRDDERPLVPNVLHAACRSACAAAGLSKPVTVHTLRHTFATHLLENGADVRIIQVLLGHASLASTARYTRVATKTISNTPSPLDRLRLEVVPPG
jgi:integrase